MATPNAPACKPLFLDTTIQVERATGTDVRRAEAIHSLFGEFRERMACAFSRLEFKHVVIQGLSHVLNCLLEYDPPSYAGAVSKLSRITNRRANTLENILGWVGRQANAPVTIVVQGEGPDEMLARQAISYIRVAVMSLWYGFDLDLLAVTDKLGCQRAKEAPRLKRTGSIEDTIHVGECSKRQCSNANFFNERRASLIALRNSLQKLREADPRLSEELKTAEAAITAAAADSSRLYDYGRCLELADVWIHLESVAAGAKDFATLNYKESQHLCPLLQLQMRCEMPRRS